MSLPRNVFDCQPARRVPEELHDDSRNLANSRNLATPSEIHRREGIEKSESEEPLQSIPLPCISVRAREKSLEEYFRPTGSYDEIQGLSGLFSINLENDDIQDFDLRWEQAFSLTSDPPSDKVLDRIPLEFRQLWHCTIKNFCEEEDNEIIETGCAQGRGPGREKVGRSEGRKAGGLKGWMAGGPEGPKIPWPGLV